MQQNIFSTSASQFNPKGNNTCLSCSYPILHALATDILQILRTALWPRLCLGHHFIICHMSHVLIQKCTYLFSDYYLRIYHTVLRSQFINGIAKNKLQQNEFFMQMLASSVRKKRSHHCASNSFLLLSCYYAVSFM